jgi:hypothetical protein
LSALSDAAGVRLPAPLLPIATGDGVKNGPKTVGSA